MKFYKYEGTGNDFIMIDNRKNFFSKNEEQIKFLCDRKFGIGADGLILLENHKKFDFQMKYFNSDGKIASMCGNGGRCIVAFAKKLKIINNKTKFSAFDGSHNAEIYGENFVKLQMNNLEKIDKIGNSYFLNTGSPHFCSFVENLENINLLYEAKKIRYNDMFKKKGTNVNFIEKKENKIFVRTYERGVEDETLSCGTGVVASAIANYLENNPKKTNLEISTKGGILKVFFEKNDNIFKNIFLQGKANFVFEGTIF